MAIEGALEGLFAGVDAAVELVVYTSSDESTVLDTTSWTNVLLDIRKRDTSSTAKLSKSGSRSGTFNASPGVNTQKWTFTLTDDELAATVFPGDDWTGRYSIKRTDSGSEQILRYGDVTITRVTQV